MALSKQAVARLAREREDLGPALRERLTEFVTSTPDGPA